MKQGVAASVEVSFLFIICFQSLRMFKLPNLLALLLITTNIFQHVNAAFPFDSSNVAYFTNCETSDTNTFVSYPIFQRYVPALAQCHLRGTSFKT